MVKRHELHLLNWARWHPVQQSCHFPAECIPCQRITADATAEARQRQLTRQMLGPSTLLALSMEAQKLVFLAATSTLVSRYMVRWLSLSTFLASFTPACVTASWLESQTHRMMVCLSATPGRAVRACALIATLLARMRTADVCHCQGLNLLIDVFCLVFASSGNQPRQVNQGEPLWPESSQALHSFLSCTSGTDTDAPLERGASRYAA